MTETRIVNIKDSPCDIYIGRSRKGFHFGNPFSSKRSAISKIGADSVEESIQMFRDWLKGERFCDVEQPRRVWILENIESLRGHTLGCFCRPGPCHGDVYLEFLGEQQEDSLSQWME